MLDEYQIGAYIILGLMTVISMIFMFLLTKTVSSIVFIHNSDLNAVKDYLDKRNKRYWNIYLCIMGTLFIILVVLIILRNY